MSMNNPEPFDEVRQVRVNRSNEDGLLNDELTLEFKRTFSDKARYNLEQEYLRSQREIGFSDGPPTEADLVTFAASRGLIGQERPGQRAAEEVQQGREAVPSKQPTKPTSSLPEVVVPPMPDDMLARELSKFEAELRRLVESSSAVDSAKRLDIEHKIRAYRNALPSNRAVRPELPSSGQQKPNETLPEAEDRLKGQIGALTQDLAKTSDPDERRRIIEAIRGLEAGVNAIRAERGTPPIPSRRFEEDQADKGVANPALTGKVTASDSVGVSVGFVGGRYEKVEASAKTFEDALDQLLVARPWSQSIRGILQSLSGGLKPIWTRGRIARFTVENVMLGILQHGLDYKADPAHVAGKLAAISKLTSKEVYGLLTESVWLRVETDPNEPPTILDQRLESVFARAEQISKAVTSEHVIAVRHLVAAILLPPAEGTQLGSVCRLPANIFPATAMAEALVEHVRTATHFHDDDELEKWSDILRDLDRAIQAGKESRQAGLGGSADLRAWDAEFATLRRDSGYRWSTTLDRVLDLLWEEHSRAFKESLGDNGRRFEPQISPRALFLAALEYSATNDAALKDRSDNRGQTLSMICQATGLTADRIGALLRNEFFRPMPPGRTAQSRAVVSDELSAAIKRADAIRSSFGGDPYIGTRHLILALLEAPPGGKTGDLVIRDDDGIDQAAIIAGFRDSMTGNAWVQRYDDNADWGAQFQKLEAELTEARKAEDGSKVKTRHEVGSKDEWDRDAVDNEVGLRADDYAAALREVFTKAGQGEFSLAIFGHWGRGKTFLMNRLKKQLEGDKYQTVFFSAWKYPTTPEVWVHLYETIADRACSGPVWTVLPRIIRTGIARHGPWPIIGALAALAFSLTPKLQLIKLVGVALADYVRLVGVGGLVWLGILALGVRRTKAKLSQNYITATRHTEKLGLQATIGRDLKALLNGWMPTGSNRPSWPLVCYAGVSLWIAWSAWAWFGLRAGQEAIHLWPRVTAAVVAGLVMLLLACWALCPIRKPNRLLLVIDDLDRCSTDQLLHVVESVKLLTEEAEISKRMQVAALVDEDILEHAVLSKHKDLGAAHCADKFKARRIIRENCEKLFTAHLRLPPLDRHELQEVFELVVSKDRKAKAKAAEDAKVSALEKAKQNLREANEAARETTIVTEVVRPPIKPDKRGLHDGDPGEVKTRELTEAEIQAREKAADEARARLDSLKAQEESNQAGKQAAAGEGDAPKDSILKVNFRFGQDEEAVIAAAVAKLSEISESGPWGPRSVRAFIFRYQLARMLATRLYGDDWTPQRICDLFVELAKPAEQRAVNQTNAKLARIVQQVA